MNIMVTGASGGYGSYAINFLKEFAPKTTSSHLCAITAKELHLKQKALKSVWLITQIFQV